MTTPQIIAHRGASYLAPENTLVAFRKAMEIGADGVEMDVQKTYDNELVIHHDYMVDMHTDISGQIYDLTMGELKALRTRLAQAEGVPAYIIWPRVSVSGKRVLAERLTGDSTPDRRKINR